MTPDAFLLPPGDWVPNNPWLPVLVYRAVLPRGISDPARGLEEMFAHHGWPPRWRNGILPYHHGHSTAHEVLGIAAGGTEVLLGGPGGRRLDVTTGDVLVLPAGTGHCNLAPARELVVVGAYPPGQNWDVRRDALPPEALQRMRNVPLPKSDPVSGPAGPLTGLWKTD